MSQLPMSTEYGVEGLPGHVRGFALMHVAMRRDARRLVGAAATAPPAAYGQIGPWWSMLRDTIEWHHISEDRVLFPELSRRRLIGFAAHERALRADHDELDQAMDAVTAALHQRSDPSVLRRAAADFHTVLTNHLRTEESLTLPIFTDQLTVHDYLAIERRVISTARPRVMTFLQPWMFDGAGPRAIASVAATIPPPVRLLGNTVMRWRYDRVVAPVLALI